MGGGDLNLKKSWDPRRLDNQEKKWKLEEMEKKEQKRLAELKEERQEERALEEMRRRGEDAGVIEKRKDRLDWMYKGPGGHVNPDDYLLGKEVDKVIVDKQSGKTQSNGAQDRGVLSSSAVLGSSGSLTIDAKDMARKMREDPLFAIKKRELNNRKELVSNPIRMKQLQQLLHSQVGSDKKKSKKAKKHKEKKRKKHKRSQETDSESDSDDDPAPRHPKRRVQDFGASSDRHKGKNHMRGHNRKHSSSGSDSDRGHGRGKEQTLASLNKSRMKELLEREILKKHRGKKDRSESSSSESNSEDQESYKQQKRHKSAQKMKRLHSDERGRDHISSPPASRSRQRHEEEKIPFGYGLQRGARSQRRSPSPAPAISPTKYKSDKRDKYSSRNRDRSPNSRTKHHEKKTNRYEGDRSPSPQSKGDRYRKSDNRGDKRRGRSRSRSPLRHHGRSADKLSRSKSPQQKNSQRDMAPKRKLTAEEMERKRAEMMTNAKWRDDQRKSRVMTYEKEERAEVEMEKKKSKNAEFVQPLKLPENSSVEDRIHRNIYNIQRTKAALDKNFAKR